MTEELTAEERASVELNLAVLSKTSPAWAATAKLLRLYDVALARVEVAEKSHQCTLDLLPIYHADLVSARAEALSNHMRAEGYRARSVAAESALAEATATLDRVRRVPLWSPQPAEPEEDDDGPLYQGFLTDQGGQWIRIDDLLEALRTPAPAAPVDGCPVTTDTLLHLAECAHAWEPGARLLGNVTARELQLFCAELINYRRVTPTAPAATAEPVREYTWDGHALPMVSPEPPPLRSRAEVDAEIAGCVRNWTVTGRGYAIPDGMIVRLTHLCAEPTAPEPAPEGEQPPRDELLRRLARIAEISKAAYGVSAQQELLSIFALAFEVRGTELEPNPLTDHDQDTREERPCGCEESDALKLRIERLVDAQEESRRLLRFAFDLAQQIVQALETTPDA